MIRRIPLVALAALLPALGFSAVRAPDTEATEQPTVARTFAC